MRRKLLLLAVTVVVLVLAFAPVAGAQGYTGWIENPYPSAGLWYCDYYGEEYWCQNEPGVWFRANPDWYNANSREMMDVYGQPVL